MCVDMLGETIRSMYKWLLLLNVIVSDEDYCWWFFSPGEDVSSETLASQKKNAFSLETSSGTRRGAVVVGLAVSWGILAFRASTKTL